MQKPNVYLFPQLDDNYGYLIKNPHETKGVLVDPSDLDMSASKSKIDFNIF